jgi:hypothetical protein
LIDDQLELFLFAALVEDGIPTLEATEFENEVTGAGDYGQPDDEKQDRSSSQPDGRH